MQIPDDWQRAADEIVASPQRRRVIMVVGAPDVGKSSFCAYLASRLQETGLRTAVVDADIGQASIGPPTVIGAGFVTAPIGGLSQIGLAAGYFVGSITPTRHLLPCVVGTRKMTERMLALQAVAVVVDTTGLVLGDLGRELKQREFELLTPTHTVVIQNRSEIAHLARQWQPVRWTTVFELEAPAAARPRSREERRQYRMERFREHFQNARELTVSLDEVVLSTTWLKQGQRLSEQECAWLADPLGSEVVHGERLGDRAVLITAEAPYRSGIAFVRQMLGTDIVSVVPAGRFGHLLVGLLDDGDEWLSLGLIRYVDFRGQQLRLLAPPLRSRRLCKVVFGSLRVRPDGSEIGWADLDTFS